MEEATRGQDRECAGRLVKKLSRTIFRPNAGDLPWIVSSFHF